ncbi:MAG: non-canonical purine NTP pyrophosphatase [Limisphaerales bacterium]
MTTLLIATRNAHKVGEIQAILGSGFTCRALLKEFPAAPVAIEDADTFAGNALKKAESLSGWLTGLSATERSGLGAERTFVLADDSGLEVDALAGAPGVHSARFAAMDSGHEGNSPDADNNAKLLRLLADVPQARRTARFRCVLALVAVNDGGAEQPDARQRVSTAPQLFEGACEGWIDFAPRGSGGFGYDPLFIPLGQENSFAELGESVKNGLSHRAKALAKLRAWFSGGK